MKCTRSVALVFRNDDIPKSEDLDKQVNRSFTLGDKARDRALDITFVPKLTVVTVTFLYGVPINGNIVK